MESIRTTTIGPSDPSTFKYTDEEWAEVCKKDAFTAEEIAESTRRNGIGHIFSTDIHVSNAIKDDLFNDGWRN